MDATKDSFAQPAVCPQQLPFGIGHCSLPTFKIKANEDQFKHNIEIFAMLDKAKQAVAEKLLDAAQETLEQIQRLLGNRQRLIMVADKSGILWNLAVEHIQNDVADGSDNDNIPDNIQYSESEEVTDPADNIMVMTEEGGNEQTLDKTHYSVESDGDPEDKAVLQETLMSATSTFSPLDLPGGKLEEENTNLQEIRENIGDLSYSQQVNRHETATTNKTAGANFPMNNTSNVDSNYIAIKTEYAASDFSNSSNDIALSITGKLGADVAKNSAVSVYPPQSNEKVNSNTTTSKLNDQYETNGKQYICEVCNKSFEKPSNLKRHVFIHRATKDLQCDDCKKKFRCHRNLYKHMREQHPMPGKVFSCKECGKTFERFSLLKRHRLTHRALTCELCGKLFSCNAHLTAHMLTHTGEKPYHCHICNRRFARKAELKDHIPMHSSERPHACSICQGNFKTEKSLNVHTRKTHSSNRYACDLCEKVFKQTSQLKKHLLSHTNEKPYVCDICGKCFVGKKSLDIHKLNHTGERPHECQVCKKAFARLWVLKEHERIHTGEKPFVCDICGRRFRISLYLTKHLLTHTNKPHMCDICKKSYKNADDLKKHLLIHEENKW